MAIHERDFHSNVEIAPHVEQEEHSPSLLVVGHTYQPHRESYVPTTEKRLDMASFVNEVIDNQVYRPIFEDTDQVPEGIFSYYAPLRDWKMGHTPESFETAKRKINEIKDKEYRIMGDSYLHLILPLQPEEDQDMLVKIGKQAFREDFGFDPKGFWPAETAIDATTLRVLYNNGYEYVTLRNDQITNAEENPMYVPVRDKDGAIMGEIAVVHFNAGLSGAVSYQDHYTQNGDEFLGGQRFWNPGKDIAIGSDTELYGHHKQFRDQFLKYVTKPDVLQKHGYSVFDVKPRLEDPDHQYAEVWERSSWSCPHGLGRWTGECDCDNPNEAALRDKKEFYHKLTDYGLKINAQLNSFDPEWRKRFSRFFLGVRSEWFHTGDVNQKVDQLSFDPQAGLEVLQNTSMSNLYFAKMCELVGKTSCGWFFPDVDRVERELPKTMISEIEKLVPEVMQLSDVEMMPGQEMALRG